jgi:hypothetical protein
MRDTKTGIERRELLALAGATAAGLLTGQATANTAPTPDALVAAWDDFCETLKGAAPPLLAAPAQSPTERASALQYLTRLTRHTLETELEQADPAFPRFYRSQTDNMQQGGPNPDTSYISATISGDHAYRVFGRRHDVGFVTISTLRGLAAIQQGKPGFVDNLVGEALTTDEEGAFEIRVGPRRPDGYDGNFLLTSSDTEAIMVREIFGDWNEETPMELHIERIDGEGAMPPPLDFDTVAAALHRSAARTAFMADFWVKDLARFEGSPNQFLEYQKRDPEKRSIAYTPGGVALVGVWQVEPEQALLLEVEPPDSPYWAYELGDYWFLVDYWNAFSSVNQAQMVVDADGVARTVVSHVDPGGWPNWLSTSGHTTGHMVFRWLESSEEVTPRVRQVSLDELDELLPKTTQRLTPSERARQLADRRAGLRRRWPV